MFDTTQLLGFLAAVAVLVLVPGPNTFLILGQTLAGGRGTGLATVAGIEAGTLVHTLAAALGLSAVLSTSALAFGVVKFAGVAYLFVLGLQALRNRDHSPARLSGARAEMPRVFRRALLSNVLNPKVALFFLALLPQFVRPEHGHVMLQFVMLGLIVSAFGLCFGSLLALAAAQISRWLRHGAVARWQARVAACVFLTLAAWLALAQPH